MSGNVLDTSLEDACFANVAPMNEDWYHGHKVVAMPSSAFGGMSIREVVSSRNENEQSNNPRPRRSNSLGRQPARPGRDLVQDVYDRMGVSYTRGVNYETTPPPSAASGYEDNNHQATPIQQTPSFSEASEFSANSNNNYNSAAGATPRHSTGKMKDKFSGRYRAAAAVTRSNAASNRPADPKQHNRGRATEPRGRAVEPEEFESEGRRRARSLSRGLSVRGIWPPPKDQPVDVTPVNNDTPVGYNVSNAPTEESCRTQNQPQVPNSPNRPKSPVKRSHSFDARPQYGGGLRTSQTAMHNKARNSPMDMNGGGVRDEKKENDDPSVVSDASESGKPSIPSIKDRISAFAGKSSTPRHAPRRNTYAPSNSYMKSPTSPPPKVDIYGREGDYGAPYRPEDTTTENAGEVPDAEDEEYVPQPPESTPDPSFKYMRPSQMALSKQKTAARPPARSSIANSYLNGIQSPGSSNRSSCFQQQQSPQMMDGSVNSNYQGMDDMNHGISDSNSVGGGSSVSYGDSDRARKSPWQKSGSSYKNKANVVSSNSSAKSSGGGDVSMEMIERMVDERVQVQLREVEARMEGLLRRWMDSMNNKITSRLDAMERSIKDSLPRQEI